MIEWRRSLQLYSMNRHIIYIYIYALHMFNNLQGPARTCFHVLHSMRKPVAEGGRWAIEALIGIPRQLVARLNDDGRGS